MAAETFQSIAGVDARVTLGIEHVTAGLVACFARSGCGERFLARAAQSIVGVTNVFVPRFLAAFPFTLSGLLCIEAILAH